MSKKRLREEVEHAKKYIDIVFGDTTVSQEETLDAMEELEEYVSDSISALRADMKEGKK